MATMNVSLPDTMKAWVEEQTHTGKFGNASDYVRDLIRRDQERQSAVVQLQRLIDESIESGVSSRTFQEILEDARAQAATRRKP